MSFRSDLRDSLRSALFDNVALKVIALATALGIYIFIHGSDNAHRTMSLSVVSIPPPDKANRQLLTPLPTEVAVTLRGSRAQLDDLRNDDLGSVQLDLHTGTESRVILDESMIRVPPGVAVLEFNPREIDLQWDDIISRELPIQVARTGEPVLGNIAKSIVVEPQKLNARGPQSIVSTMQFARVAPFDITGLTEGIYRRPLPLDRPPKFVTYDIDSVTATVEIDPQIVFKDFPKLKVEVVGKPHATVQPAMVTVRVWGLAHELASIAPENIVPRVEPESIKDIDLSKPGSKMMEVLVDVGHKNDPHPPKAEVNPSQVLVRW